MRPEPATPQLSEGSPPDARGTRGSRLALPSLAAVSLLNVRARPRPRKRLARAPGTSRVSGLSKGARLRFPYEPDAPS